MKIICQRGHCILRRESKTHKAVYSYNAKELVGEDCFMEFNLLSEVGEHWQATFKSMLEESDYILGKFESSTEYYDILTKKIGA